MKMAKTRPKRPATIMSAGDGASIWGFIFRFSWEGATRGSPVG
jgi:hypothetical protein